MRHLTRDTAIMLGLLAALGVAALVFVFLPHQRQLGRLQGQIAQQKSLLASETQKVAVVPTMLKNVEAMKRRYKDFDRRLPKGKELGGFLREVSQFLAEEGLADLVIEPGAPSREPLFHTLPIVIRCRGSYLALARLMKRIHGMQRLTRVQGLLIASDPRLNDLEIQLQMNIYFSES